MTAPFGSSGQRPTSHTNLSSRWPSRGGLGIHSRDELWPAVGRKLDQIDAVTSLDDLRVPPGNRLHALVGDLAGFYAIRVNDQYRVVFRFDGHDAYDVRCTDYH